MTTILRRIGIAWLAITALTMAAAHGASTTNFADHWGVPAEPGWGAAVLQQSNTLFVTLSVYGVDGRPTWFFAPAFLQAGSTGTHTVFVGDLYATTGPYYGTPRFDPAMVVLRKVGTLTFDAASPNAATISYTVDGTPVAKNVTRETWSYDIPAGAYYGGWNADRSHCIQGPANETHFDEPLGITITGDAGNDLTFTLTFADNTSISFSGAYAQSGHLGRIDGELPNGRGIISVTELETTSSGFTAKFTGDVILWHDWCEMNNGRIGGVRR